MPTITLHRATPDDLDTFIELEKSVAHLKVYSSITDRSEAREEIQNNTVYLIKRENTVVGSIEYQMKDTHHAYLSGFVVNPRYQGQGIGREALMQILEDLKEIKRVDLVTHPHNTPAIMLYLSLGFIIEGWKDNYFGDGEPRVILSRTL